MYTINNFTLNFIISHHFRITINRFRHIGFDHSISIVFREAVKLEDKEQQKEISDKATDISVL